MKPCVLLLAILALPGFGQPVVGTVEKVEKDQFQVKTKDSSVTFKADEKTCLTKLETYHDLSPLKAGDEVRVTFYGEGTFTAVNVSVKVAITGVITEARSGSLSMVAEPESHPGGRSVQMFVFIDHNTKFEANRKEFAAGRKVQVVGWDAGNKVIDAERISIHDIGTARAK